ncbi:MAG: DUF4386 domain-containing protein [Promethearchaeota archaeon]|nr:MAG: DUF4386 domain-containing protein [Candidatus Lokiarchaeota archaeon]
MVLQVAMAAFGYILEPTPKHYDSDAKLLNFNNNPKRFQTGITLALIEHFCVIALAIMLFFVVNPYSILLGIVLIIFRLAEGGIQVYLEKDYWGLLNIAVKYSSAGSAEKNSLLDSYRNILRTKSNRFAFAMVGWSIGSFAFSIVLVIYGVAPLFIGWLGIVASILIGFANVMKLLKPDVKAYEAISSISGLLAIVFEILIGGWLLFFAHVIP